MQQNMASDQGQHCFKANTFFYAKCNKNQNIHKKPLKLEYDIQIVRTDMSTGHKGLISYGSKTEWSNGVAKIHRRCGSIQGQF